MIVIWTERAKHNLQDIYDYIFLDSPQNAEVVIETLLELGESTKEMPYKYPKESNINKENIRFIPKWNFKIIYSIHQEYIYIVRVFQTKQHSNKINF